jgi:hypothetical protein
MEARLTHAGQFVETLQRFARRLLAVGEDRFEVLLRVFTTVGA